MREHRLLRLLIIATVYFLTAWIGFSFAIQPTHSSPVWLASGVALGAVLLFGNRTWPGIWIGAFLANTMFFFDASTLWTIASSVMTGGIVASGATLEAIFGAWILRKISVRTNPLDETRGAVAFILLSGFLACVISATLAITSLCIAGSVPWQSFGAMWWPWWLGDAIGVLVVTPLFLNWKYPAWSWKGPGRSGEVTIFMILLIVDCVFIFERFAGASIGFLLYTIVPFLAWSAFRYGPKETSLVTITIALFAIKGTVSGNSPLVGNSVTASFLLIDGFLTFAVLKSLLFSSLVTQRRIAEAAVVAEAEHRLKIISTQQEIAKICMDLEATMTLTCERAKELTGASGAVIEMCEIDEMAFRACSRGAEPTVGLRVKVATSLSGKAIITGQTLKCDDSHLDSRVDRAACDKMAMRSLVVSPLKFAESPIGVLKVFSSQATAFSDRDVQTLELLAGLVASAIKHAAEFDAKQALLAERTSAMVALEQSEKRVRVVLDTAYDAFIAVDERAVITEWNLQAEQIFGWTRGEALGHFLGDVILGSSSDPRGDASALIEFDTTAERNRRIELKMQRRDGSEFPVELTVTPILFAKNKMFAMFVRDITESKEADAALRQSEQRFRSLAGASPVGIFEADAAGNCLYTNARWQQIVGLSFEESLNDGWASALHPDDAPRVFQQWKEHAEQRREFSQEFRFKHKDGTVRWVQCRACMIATAHSKLVGYVGTIVDITEQKEWEQKMEAALKEKQVLLKEVHHRVKNNLQVVTSLLNLQASYIEDPRALELFNESQDRIKTIALIHEKLYQTDDVARVNFAEYTRNLTSYLASSLVGSTKQISFNIDIPDVTFSIDTAVPCGLIINELISNSLKHAFEGRANGEISIELRRPEQGTFLLSVRDNGVGLPHNLDLKESKTLGLLLVTALTSQINGTLQTLNSCGATFNITFNPKDYA